MYQSRKKIIRNDIIVILIPLVIAVIFFIFTLAARSDGETAVIFLEGEQIARYSLSEDTVVPIKNSDGETLLILTIKDGKAEVSESVCHDHSCERMGPVSRSGESIICLISQVVIKIEGSKNEIDAVAFISQGVKMPR